MADTVEQQDIRGLDIDKTVKGFALTNYIFKSDCLVSSTSADSIRWYQETSADLTSTAPSYVANISPLSQFPTLEASWTRNTSYVRKYAAEGFLSMEDMKSADIDVFARTLLRLTRAVTKQVDTRIFNVLTESLSPSSIQTFATTAVGGDQWDAASYAGNPVKDILHAKKLIADYGYSTDNLVMYLNQADATILMDWLIAGKGSSIPQFASDKIQTGVLMSLLGVTIKVSPNVTADNAVVFIPQVSCTWKSHTPITSRVIEEAGIGSKIRVFELGEAILTDPKSVVLITDLETYIFIVIISLYCMVLISQFKLNENAANTTVSDEKSRISGTASTNTSNLSTTGKINNCFYFVGNNTTYVSLASSASNNTRSYTFWIKQDSSPSGDRFMRLVGDYGFINSTGKIYISYYNANGGYSATSLTKSNANSVWRFITVISNPSGNGLRWRIYVDTTLEVDEVKPLLKNTSAGASQLGYSDSINYFKGWLDDIRIFDHILTPYEIIDLYNNGNGTESDPVTLTSDDPTNTIGTTEIDKHYPNEYGLIAETTKQRKNKPYKFNMGWGAEYGR